MLQLFINSNLTRAVKYKLIAALIAAFPFDCVVAFPSKPIKLVVPFAPGGTTDLVARLMAEELSKGTGHTVVVENRPGAGGNVGMAYVAKVPGDGHTWGVVGNSFAVNPALYRAMPYRQSDLLPVAIVAAAPFVLVANPSAPFRSIEELVSYATSRPGEVAYASGGSGTIGHLGAHWLAQLASIDLRHVAYKGAAPALADVMAGHVPLYFDTLTTGLALIQKGKVRPLLVTSSHRLPQLPSVPTAAERGYPQLTKAAWIGIVVPAATPPATINLVKEFVNRALLSEGFRSKLNQLGTQPLGGSISSATAFVGEETRQWGAIVRASGAQAD